ncbi:MAG: FMN-binding protein [Verrucomicrobiales bacterium]
MIPLLFLATASAQDDVYQKPSEFISETFGGNAPKAGAITLTKAQQGEIKKLIGRFYSSNRVRYWTDGKKAAWILEEIGKTKPITIGCVTSAGKIVRITVLIYRESHGWEVKQPFFTNQFRNTALKSDGKLSASIDNIAGATLSTRAMTKMAKLALYLDKQS